jgi:hypothetical protein
VRVRDVSRRVQRHFVSSDPVDLVRAECLQEGYHRPDNRNTVVVARPAAVGWWARLLGGDEKDFQGLEVPPLPRRRGSFSGLHAGTDQAAVAQ